MSGFIREFSDSRLIITMAFDFVSLSTFFMNSTFSPDLYVQRPSLKKLSISKERKDMQVFIGLICIF